MVSLPDVELPGTILATRYGLLNICAKVNKYKYVLCLIAGMFLEATKIKKRKSLSSVTIGKQCYTRQTRHVGWSKWHILAKVFAE
jgi:hypothetical protein